MGESVEFTSNGGTAAGYLARPASGRGPGLLVLQEWWGLVPQLERVCDRLAAEGFTALAPDLYHGEMSDYQGRTATHEEMDRAAGLMAAMPPDRAARDMAGAIDFLLADRGTTGDAVGVIGFCMGGMLALTIAATAGDRVAACVPFYGAPLGEMAPDWSGLTAAVEGHFAERDGFFPTDAVLALESELRAAGKDVTFVVYPDTDHAFGNEDDPLGNHHAEATAASWARSVAFLRSKLG
jgi:carboxymethylenebutenolidase